jgi:tRNA G18 (ribose-2'-O)-methylase SpoU
MNRKPLSDAFDVAAGARRLLVLEEVNNHTNVGAILRAAAALGVDAVLLDPRSADPLYRRSVKVSMGAVFAVPWARLPGWPASLDRLRDLGFTVLALTPDPAAVPLDELPAAASERVALVLGAEGPGLSPGALAAADLRVRIPMSAGVDSLNVAAAAAVACYAISRQRRR